jgi:hypothetical protein
LHFISGQWRSLKAALPLTRAERSSLYHKLGNVADLNALSNATDLIESLYTLSCEFANTARSLFVFGRERHRLQ